MKTDLELLAPGGDIDAIKAAIAAGADAVYCGLNKFNARDRATNLSAEDLPGIVSLAHKHGCSVFVTLNIIVVESEIPALIRLLNTLVNTRIDAVIVQDFGLFYLLNKHFPSLVIHASTQLTTHNEGQVRFLSALNATRVNLCRELNLEEIRALTDASRKQGMDTEVFVHGSYCVSFSGLCYLSSVLGGKSGNRGRCSQPCRDRFETTPAGREYPLNLKDNSAYGNLKELAEAGVYSLKIEGRIKKFDYVHTVVSCWRNQIQSLSEKDRLLTDTGDLAKVFNRDFSNGFLAGEITSDMFIDNPRDHSIRQVSKENPACPQGTRERFYEDKAALSARARLAVGQLRVEKTALTFRIHGEPGAPLGVSVSSPEASFSVASDSPLAPRRDTSAPGGLSRAVLLEKFKRFDNSEYRVDAVDTENLAPGLYLPFKELTALIRRVAFLLNGSREPVAPVAVPSPGKPKPVGTPPVLSVMISSPGDIPLCEATPAEIFFRLPEALENRKDEFIALFNQFPKLTPWFPAVLIGEDYTAAREILEAVRPDRIVTDNSGVAFDAFRQGIAWMAGSCFNLVNSFGLRCLKEQFGCSGAIVSREINKEQLKRLVPPEGMELCMGIYHPVTLMTSRQCLHQGVIGCSRKRFDKTCLEGCDRSSSITHANGATLHVHKSGGNHHRLYHETHCLNTAVVADLPHTFSRFFIDLRDIATHTKTDTDKAGLIALFHDLLKGVPGAEAAIHRAIRNTSNVQYVRGI
ncbi:peptidase U32 family protein [Desulfoluna butyratoxydans]|uniref:Peptidase u32 n=1 Tax=Desulfoluna butyratoxydans TaxID=231438 RepID=A0A4U8YYA4_9BACT|nr:U32 family peptidase [Desulfoluna butyratoxydans]VFQ47102.1 peptidase u32 [Desulfoluna butyratoxydans]